MSIPKSLFEVALATGGETLPYATPPRFAHCTFDSYKTDPAFPSQEQAWLRLKAYVEGEAALGRLLRRKTPSLSGIFLDGPFGVGKTHLVAAAANSRPKDSAFVPFDDILHYGRVQRMDTAVLEFAHFGLVCIDSVDLDDGLSLAVAREFVSRLLAHGKTRVVTSSNTVPEVLAAPRNADFSTRLARRSRLFEVIRVEGNDYLKRSFTDGKDRSRLVDRESLAIQYDEWPGERKLLVSLAGLIDDLRPLSPTRYRLVASHLDALFVEQLSAIKHESDALRFVHFIDRIFESNVRLRMSGRIQLATLFDAEYRMGMHVDRFSRALARMEEMLVTGGHA